MGTIEIVGILLILMGVIYIFLQGMGKLSDKDGEIKTQILSLKGGAGLILVTLGILLLALFSGIQFPAGLSEKLPPPAETKTNLGIATPARTPIPTNTPASTILTPLTVPRVTISPKAISSTNIEQVTQLKVLKSNGVRPSK